MKESIPKALVLDTLTETVNKFRKVWKSHSDFPLNKKMINTIDTHLDTLSIWTE